MVRLSWRVRKEDESKDVAESATESDMATDTDMAVELDDFLGSISAIDEDPARSRTSEGREPSMNGKAVDDLDEPTDWLDEEHEVTQEARVHDAPRSEPEVPPDEAPGAGPLPEAPLLALAELMNEALAQVAPTEPRRDEFDGRPGQRLGEAQPLEAPRMAVVEPANATLGEVPPPEPRPGDLDGRLDEALVETFPASDPVAVSHPG